MINDFSRIFDRDLESFQNYENKKEIVEVLFEAQNHIDEVVRLIKSDFIEDEGNIFTNLLSLLPFSSPIVGKFLETALVSQKDVLNKLDLIFETTSNMKNLLTRMKRMVKDDGFSFSQIEERLNEVEKELKKYEKELQKKQELQKKINRLNYLENEVKDIKELESYIKKLESAKSTIDFLKKDIDKSRRIFRDICKGDA